MSKVGDVEVVIPISTGVGMFAESLPAHVAASLLHTAYVSNASKAAEVATEQA